MIFPSKSTSRSDVCVLYPHVSIVRWSNSKSTDWLAWYLSFLADFCECGRHDATRWLELRWDGFKMKTKPKTVQVVTGGWGEWLIKNGINILKMHILIQVSVRSSPCLQFGLERFNFNPVLLYQPPWFNYYLRLTWSSWTMRCVSTAFVSGSRKVDMNITVLLYYSIFLDSTYLNMGRTPPLVVLFHRCPGDNSQVWSLIKASSSIHWSRQSI